MVKTIGCMRMRRGRNIERQSFFHRGLLSSPLKVYFVGGFSPFSSCLLRVARMIGGYCSRKKIPPANVLAEQTIVRTQNIQRHPSLLTMTPPSNGPIVGPRSGPRRYQPKTDALSSVPHMSLIVPPPFAILTLPKNPLSVRMNISVSIFGVKAEGICNNEN